jgi:hypothetical protein
MDAQTPLSDYSLLVFPYYPGLADQARGPHNM